MRAAIVRGAGEVPSCGEFDAPGPLPGESRIAVTAAAVSQVVKAQASGTHYSSSSEFPLVIGIDGVGHADDGRRVYFVRPRSPYGSMAEKSVVRSSHCIALPEDLDDLTAAAIAIPGASSWVAFNERARLKTGETVLVNGATGTSGRLAVQIAKHLGAAKVVATGRNVESLRSLNALGADVTIPLAGPEAKVDELCEEQFAQGVDIVLDYLWGRSAERLLIAAAKAAAEAVPIRFIQIGSAGGPDITLPSPVLRSSAIELMGSGIGSVPPHRFLNAIEAVFKATISAGLKIAFTPTSFSNFDRAWLDDDSARRTVFTMGR